MLKDSLTIARYVKRGNWLRLGKKLIDVLTPSEQDWRDSPEYRRWKKKVHRRDSYTCQDCFKSRNELDELHAHHILRASTHPERRFDVKNGVSLCRECHANRHKRAGEMGAYNLLKGDE